ncbi:CPBP family intramembrane glutamic endopeptidase [Mucilaginibacter sp. 44-25]|uniref:CPBP family intramembrane glutamic endopeptidase n=1 Tax=Mucilaginibacter sp. 44-25 TaxID=1895794 RepID=UPI000AAF7043|nr:CPBP family intramembrane glutamic endopeptidase [Mucilaginibacter sp. 44-25]
MTKAPVNQTSARRQFFYFLVICAGLWVIMNVVAVIGLLVYDSQLVKDIATVNTDNPKVIPVLYFLQLVTMTIPLFAGPVIFAAWVMRKPAEYLKTTWRFTPILLVVVFFVMLVSSPLIELLSNINHQMVLPSWLKWLEDWMKQSEENAKQLTTALLQMNSLWDCIKNVLLVGLFTAIAEEFLFRGGMQTILLKWTKNKHTAIWVTAAIFSAFHLEFYGFLPRMLLGALFGYFVVYSGSIWPAVWGHFLNNGTAVVATYLYQNKRIKLNPDDQHIFTFWQYAFSLIIIIILLLVYKKIAGGKSSPVLNGEELG